MRGRSGARGERSGTANPNTKPQIKYMGGAGAGTCASMRRQCGLLHKIKVEMNRGFAAKVTYKAAGRREERKSGAPCGGTFRRGQEE
jgi:hypothetical protein